MTMFLREIEFDHICDITVKLYAFQETLYIVIKIFQMNI